MEQEAGSDEKPLRCETARTRERISASIAGGIEHMGLQPKQGPILYTLRADEFLGFLDGLQESEPNP